MDKLDNERLGALIIAVAQGDVGAVEQIYNLMGRVMYAVAVSYLRELADIEDVVQTALLTIVRKADRFRENKNAYAWVYDRQKYRAQSACGKGKAHRFGSLRNKAAFFFGGDDG